MNHKKVRNLIGNASKKKTKNKKKTKRKTTKDFDSQVEDAVKTKKLKQWLTLIMIVTV